MTNPRLHRSLEPSLFFLLEAPPSGRRMHQEFRINVPGKTNPAPAPFPVGSLLWDAAGSLLWGFNVKLVLGFDSMLSWC